MRVNVTYRLEFEVTREVEIEEGDFRAWADKRYGGDYGDEIALAVWIDAQDSEFHGEVFPDWRINKPLPSDFEYQGHDIYDVRVKEESDDH